MSDVDWLHRRVHLHRNAVTVGKQTVVGSLKSGKNRTVVLPAFVVEALSATAEGKGRDELLWPSQTGGYLAPPAARESWLSGAVARCQKADPTFPRITAHALRHTAASLAISAGANPKVVQRMLGANSRTGTDRRGAQPDDEPGQRQPTAAIGVVVRRRAGQHRGRVHRSDTCRCRLSSRSATASRSDSNRSAYTSSVIAALA